jgi:hypothetical protein
MEMSKLMDGFLMFTSSMWVIILILVTCWLTYDENIRPWLEKRKT